MQKVESGKKIDYRILRVLTIVAGVIVSWYATISAFINFYDFEGTIFKIKDCVLPNPVVTPCFWGSLAFFIALVWAYKLHNKASLRGEKYFFYFMILCVLFAWSNFAVEFKGIEPPSGSIVAPCPANKTNPFLTPCFFGSIIFTISFFVSHLIVRNSKGEK